MQILRSIRNDIKVVVHGKGGILFDSFFSFLFCGQYYIWSQTKSIAPLCIRDAKLCKFYIT